MQRKNILLTKLPYILNTNGNFVSAAYHSRSSDIDGNFTDRYYFREGFNI